MAAPTKPSADVTNTAAQDHHDNVVTVTVNNRPVRLPDRKTTGREIKEAAISQGVAIDMGCVLFRVTGHHQHQVRDDETITIHEGEHFRCVAGDDNS